MLLEQNLIRKLKPPFNVQFRDDKSFPAIYFSSDHDFPGIYLTRNKKLKGIKLGPYANVTAARQSIDLTRTLFGVRNCSDMVFKIDQDHVFNIKLVNVQHLVSEKYHKKIILKK